ncbi:nucleotide kinase domain-containing protein [Pleionea mediterranea]|uniref:5-hmdU DNA kinase helical domain-containing protein n=1 Tax=Pleionea mediterranea TaxID=523701 RepID=A0A316FZ82_9GAMM|nr:nucleotide kinase domain-containing protein [Pleionea mediterranea]PWK52850.1 hypothetical protein C8D97_10468 [Pleionea mediterranea]
MKISKHNNLIKLAPPKKSEVFKSYWKFAQKRQDAFYSKLSGENHPLTDDPIIREYKFTNCFRASDRVSQYLIKNVIYSKEWSLRDTVFRILLFKIFNKIETWELLEREIGELSYSNFNLALCDQILEKARASKAAIYSAAYIMPSGSQKKYGKIKKHQFHLKLLKTLIDSGFHETIAQSNSLEELYKKLLSVESLGKFLAFQFTIDLNYSSWFNFSENDFVVAGPGALDGIKKCFVDPGGYSAEGIIKYMTDNQDKFFEQFGFKFRDLWGRKLHLIDCQNLFCEVDKYARVAHPDIPGVSGRTRIKQVYKPNTNHFDVWYPPKWGVNNNILASQAQAFGV